MKKKTDQMKLEEKDKGGKMEDGEGRKRKKEEV
jgi:hypothetical protein